MEFQGMSSAGLAARIPLDHSHDLAEFDELASGDEWGMRCTSPVFREPGRRRKLTG